jgi:chromosome segregation ATPase
VSYEVEGPDCVDVKQDKLHVCKDIAPGNYPIRVRAMDAIHRIAEKIITLSVVRAEEEAGGSSGGGSTGGSSTMEGSIDQRYNRLINSYSSVITHEKTTYEDNRYPQVDFPTGYNTEDINLAPYEIARNKAQTSEENRNVITSQDVALKVASERHQNAVKGITNLLKIIDQARANKKYAESQLEVYVKQYNDALAAQRKAQNAIIAAETKRTQIFSAIEGANGHIDGLKAQIYELDTKRADLEDAKKGLLDKIAAEEKTKAKLIAELEKINV